MASTRSEEFLSLFRELEKELCTIAKTKVEFISFSGALNKVHYDSLNPIVSSNEIYEFLKTAADLRNLLSHRNEVAQPTEEFFQRFRLVVKNILNPTKCLEIATKGDSLIISHPDDRVLEIAKLMHLRKLSHIPVYDEEGEFLGVFSRNSLFDKFNLSGRLFIDDSTKIGDLLEVVDLKQHGNESYIFVSKNTYVIDVYEKLAKKAAAERRLSCIFVTKMGRSDEPLLGIVTETDILKVIAELE